MSKLDREEREILEAFESGKVKGFTVFVLRFTKDQNRRSRAWDWD